MSGVFTPPEFGIFWTQCAQQGYRGPVAWKGGAHNPVKNACSTPLVGGQWKKGEKFKYDLHIVYNQPAPNISLGSPFEPIQYS